MRANKSIISGVRGLQIAAFAMLALWLVPVKAYAECTVIGQQCDDGSVLAGVTPDGGSTMVTTHCDIGMTWNGATCTGTRTTFAYNNGNASGDTVGGTTSTTDGDGNTALLLITDADSATGGIQPHQAAQACGDLVAHGYSDWYLPAKDELAILQTNRVAIGGFELNAGATGSQRRLWSSTEDSQFVAWRQNMPDGVQGNPVKDEINSARCVRKQPCFSPTGNTGDILYNSSSNTVQYCNSRAWIRAGSFPAGGGGCTSPTGVAGDIMFNSSSRVIQHCNGQEWSPWGQVGGIGAGTSAGNCANPTNPGGTIMYNNDFNVMQFCDGVTWQTVGHLMPTLHMDFANNVYSFNGTDYGSFASLLTATGGTITRASTASYFDIDGVMKYAANNIPRFDYNPFTRVARGILVEEQRQNRFLRSSEFNNAAWTNGGVTITANNMAAPDGTMTADSINPTGVGLAYVSQAVTWAAGNRVSMSVYAKAGGGSKVYFEQYVSGAQWAVEFDLNAGVVNNIPSGMTASMENVGNGWWRLLATRTYVGASNPGTNQFWNIYVDDYGAGVVGHNVYLWGAQFEIGGAPTSYIPTTTAAATRQRDDISIPTAAGWYAPSMGTLMAQASIPYLGTGAFPGVVTIDDGTGGNAIHLFVADFVDDAEDAEIWTGGVNVFSYAGAVIATPGKIFKLGVTYKANSMYGSADGHVGPQDTAGTLPVVTALRPGIARGAGGDTLNGWISNITYYPFWMDGTSLQSMTVTNP